MFYDLLFLVHNLQRELKKTDYKAFKDILRESFPIIYDTKLLAKELNLHKLPL